MKRSNSTRRDVLKLAGLTTAALAAPDPLVNAQEVARHGLPPVKISNRSRPASTGLSFPCSAWE